MLTDIRAMRTLKIACLLICCTLLGPEAIWSQGRKWHTRDVTRLNQLQISDYLKRNDIIFVPVGAVESNGIMPSGRDYIAPLAFAAAMAEEVDGVYFPHLAYSYPGTTVTGTATIYMTPEGGLAYFKVLAKSLLRQGYRRQVWLSSGHGPAPLTVGTLVRQFYEETHVPILYIEMGEQLQKVSADRRSKLMYGEHAMFGMLEDLPLARDYPDLQTAAGGMGGENPGLATLTELGYAGSLRLGSWWLDPLGHGGGNRSMPATATQREEWGRQGLAELKEIVKGMQLKKAMDGLRQHDEFTQKVIIPKIGKMLPSPTDSF